MHNREMTRQQVRDNVLSLTTDKQLEWMFDLGYQLTVSARGAYAVKELDGDAVRLMGFNELQHQVYGRSRHLQRREEWTLESFLDVLIAKAKVYNVEGDLGGAIQVSLNNISR
jgi:hypothetical protein